ncbi:MAG: hypothetical protein AVDCRST_MAG41-3773 [uncultured Corynebacteriales bacterium]|uniref:Uncharacterized protein n=1 Tax=uncultured Mycobacteriales bacterium TaxID=581187 RepID=A0A6J4JNT2_9ACTN|nr:MAG: hypothetical protein AVDCRST_MAG41-3773 [uncultured Corynebacteriales bacterium]
MSSVAVLAALAVPLWAVSAALLRRGVLPSARPVVAAACGLVVAAGVAAAVWKHPSWEAGMLLVGAPAIVLAVTAGRPARVLDPRWTTAEPTEEDEVAADRYAFRAVLATAASVVVLVIVFGF